MLKMCFENIIYLLSQDDKMLEEIRYRCGSIDNKILLITPFELLRLNNNEAIVLMSSIYQIKINLKKYGEE